MADVNRYPEQQIGDLDKRETVLHANEEHLEENEQLDLREQYHMEELQERLQERENRTRLREKITETNLLVKSQKASFEITKDFKTLDLKSYIEKKDSELELSIKQHAEIVNIEKTKKRLTNFTTKFNKYKAAFEKDPFLNRDNIIEKLRILTLPYQEDITECVGNSTKYPEAIVHDAAKYLNLLDGLVEPEAFDIHADRLSLIRNVTGKARSVDGLRDEPNALAVEYDDSLTQKQKSGILRMDAYLSKHATEDGGNLSFTTKILSMTMRERLFLYYAVENDVLDSINNVDIALSQTEYIPNKSNIKKKLLGRSWIFFKKIRWNKLESAIASLESEGTRNKIENAVDHMQLQQNANAGNLPDLGNAELNNKARAVLDKYKDFNNVIDICRATIADIKDNNYNDRDLELKLEVLKNRLEMVNHFGNDLETSKSELANALKGPAAAKTLGPANQYLKMLLGLVAKTPKFQAALGKLKPNSNFVKTITNAKFSGIGSYVGGSATTVLGIIGMYDSLLGGMKAFTAWDDGNMSRFDNAIKIGCSCTGFVSSVISTSLGVNTILATYGKTVATDAFKATASTVGIVTGSISLVSDAAELTMQAKHEVHHLIAGRKFDKLGLQGNSKHYAEQMLKLDHRNKRKQARTTLMKTATDAISLGATLSGNPVAIAGSALLGVLGSLGMQFTNFLIFKRTLRKTIDGFFDIEDNLETMLGGAEVLAGLKQAGFSEGDIRLKAREHMAAELGFITYDALFKHIAGKYAQFVYNGLFKDGDQLIYKNEIRPEVSDACEQFVKGLGLRIVFPENAEHEKDRRPTLSAIKKGLLV